MGNRFLSIGVPCAICEKSVFYVNPDETNYCEDCLRHLDQFHHRCRTCNKPILDKQKDSPHRECQRCREKKTNSTRSTKRRLGNGNIGNPSCWTPEVNGSTYFCPDCEQELKDMQDGLRFCSGCGQYFTS